jgi:hypothetical protein
LPAAALPAVAVGGVVAPVMPELLALTPPSPPHP